MLAAAGGAPKVGTTVADAPPKMGAVAVGAPKVGATGAGVPPKVGAAAVRAPKVGAGAAGAPPKVGATAGAPKVGAATDGAPPKVGAAAAEAPKVDAAEAEGTPPKVGAAEAEGAPIPKVGAAEAEAPPKVGAGAPIPKVGATAAGAPIPKVGAASAGDPPTKVDGAVVADADAPKEKPEAGAGVGADADADAPNAKRLGASAEDCAGSGGAEAEAAELAPNIKVDAGVAGAALPKTIVGGATGLSAEVSAGFCRDSTVLPKLRSVVADGDWSVSGLFPNARAPKTAVVVALLDVPLVAGAVPPNEKPESAGGATGAPNRLGAPREGALPKREEGALAFDASAAGAPAEEEAAALPKEISVPPGALAVPGPSSGAGGGGMVGCESTFSLLASFFENWNIRGLCNSDRHGPPRVPLLGVNENRFTTEEGAFAAGKGLLAGAGVDGVGTEKRPGFGSTVPANIEETAGAAYGAAAGGLGGEATEPSPFADGACLR